MEENLLQLGTIGMLFAFFIKEYFKSQKEKKNGGAMLAELELMNGNHLHTIQETVEKICDESNKGNQEVVKAINSMEKSVVGTLGEIKGKLSK